MSGSKASTRAGKNATKDRRARVADLAASRKKDQRNRTIRLLVICFVLALALMAYPVYLLVDDARARGASLEDLGVSVSEAGCSPVAESPASGGGDHVQVGTKVPYEQLPPVTGPHYDTPAPFTKPFYTEADRPEVEVLVHNLEHGYTVAWYRADIPDEDKAELQRISKTFAKDTFDPANKFIAAPWTAADGDGFPEGENIKLARWFANPENPGDTTQQKGVSQACSAVSGAVIKEFMAAYPATSAPEPNGA